MIKVIAVLSLLLVLAGGLSYTQHLKLKAKDVEITTQLDTIKSLQEEVKDKKDRLEIERGMSKTILNDTRVSDASYSSLVQQINEIDCSPTKEVKSNESNKDNTVDPIVTKYYNILHTAYSLQNQN